MRSTADACAGNAGASRKDALRTFIPVAGSMDALMPGPKADPVASSAPAGLSHDRAQPLAARLQGLDRDAWEAFYREHRRLVRGVLAAFVGYGPELADLTQQ